jgi:hypothetical protein
MRAHCAAAYHVRECDGKVPWRVEGAAFVFLAHVRAVHVRRANVDKDGTEWKVTDWVHEFKQRHEKIRLVDFHEFGAGISGPHWNNIVLSDHRQ